MNPDDIFWLNIWRLGAAAFCILVGTVGGCTIYTNGKIAEAKDPVAYGCALGNSRELCFTYLGKKP